MKISSDLFEAFLKCPTKCRLRFTGEPTAGNAYAEWVEAQNKTYRADAAKPLMADVPANECDVAPLVKNLKTAKWRVAVDVPARVELGSSRGNEAQTSPPENSQSLLTSAATIETCLHAVERIPSAGRGQPTQFVPILFIYRNKLTKDDKLLLAFDAFVLSEMLGRAVNLGKIIHGDDHAMLKVKTSALASEVRKPLGKITALLASPAPPDLVLNRYCAECEFQARCRKLAVEKDDLSLLAGMSAKERQKLRSKGIFTVTQLSYTFRPRRRPKRQRDKREKYHHALKALAIREQKIHIVGSPELKIEGTPVYLDVEGLPDRDFYYLIGVRIGHGDSAVQHSLWADNVADEEKIWREFLALLEAVEKPVLIHYGSYETDFLKTLSERHGNQFQGQLDNAMKNAVNLLSQFLGEIYFPTFSNGLKDIGTWLGFAWSDKMLVGLDSISRRHDWERSRDASIKERLIRYNIEDCRAAEVVNAALQQLHVANQSKDAGSQPAEVVFVRSLKPPRKRFGKFKSPVQEFAGITEAAWWDYHRDRIYLKSKATKRPAISSSNGKELGPRKIYPANKVVKLPVPLTCPSCGGECTPSSYKRRTLQDLHIGKSGVKRWVVTYKFRSYHCLNCRKKFGTPDVFRSLSKFGRNLISFLIYVSIELQTPLWTVWKMMVRFFGYEMPAGTLYALRNSAAEYYQGTFERILQDLVSGNVLHIDETQASVEGKSAYVWVFASREQAAFLYAESRDGAFLQDMLKDFKGVLVTDFYGAYDSLPCRQQKCLIHLMRDLNDIVLCNPYDEELKKLVAEFGRILKAIVETVDRRGLRARYLKKHVNSVARFYKNLKAQSYQSEAALKCKQRFEKNRNKLFTFLTLDGIPWHNNNAEHAIKAFAKHRDIVRGSFTPKTINRHLILLTVCQTCKYMGVDFLDFLRSGEKDIRAFAESRRRRRHGRDRSVAVTSTAAIVSASDRVGS
jgi:predicted RecB family nuclease